MSINTLLKKLNVKDIRIGKLNANIRISQLKANVRVRLTPELIQLVKYDYTLDNIPWRIETVKVDFVAISSNAELDHNYGVENIVKLIQYDADINTTATNNTTTIWQNDVSISVSLDTEYIIRENIINVRYDNIIQVNILTITLDEFIAYYPNESINVDSSYQVEKRVVYPIYDATLTTVGNNFVASPLPSQVEVGPNYEILPSAMISYNHDVQTILNVNNVVSVTGQVSVTTEAEVYKLAVFVKYDNDIETWFLGQLQFKRELTSEVDIVTDYDIRKQFILTTYNVNVNTSSLVSANGLLNRPVPGTAIIDSNYDTFKIIKFVSYDNTVVSTGDTLLKPLVEFISYETNIDTWLLALCNIVTPNNIDVQINSEYGIVVTNSVAYDNTVTTGAALNIEIPINEQVIVETDYTVFERLGLISYDEDISVASLANVEGELPQFINVISESEYNIKKAKQVFYNKNINCTSSISSEEGVTFLPTISQAFVTSEYDTFKVIEFINYDENVDISEVISDRFIIDSFYDNTAFIDSYYDVTKILKTSYDGLETATATVETPEISLRHEASINSSYTANKV